MNRRRLYALGVLVAATLGLAELLLRPAADDRLQLIVVLVGPAALAVAATPVFSRWVSRRASVAGAALTVALCSLALGAATSSAASNAMFVSSHDYRLFIIVLVLSSGIALIVGGQLTRPLTRDIRRLEHVAEQVAAGDLTVRSGIERTDEVGATALAIDQMVIRLAEAERERRQLGAAREHLFTSIGHDLRTPLSAIRAAVESLEDGVADDPQRYYGIITGQLASVDALLDQLIEFARLESGNASTHRERIALAELTDECAEALAIVAATRQVHIHVDTDGPALLAADPIELTRVVRNLVDNAVRHSPPGGVVELTTRTATDHIEVTVRDDGPGFPAEFREVAFEPFTRADPSRNARTGNIGLGLAICHHIVASHHGQIWLGPGPGGEVHVSLPTHTVADATTTRSTAADRS